MKFFSRVNPKLLIAIVVAILAGYAVFLFAVMTRPKGLRIYAPEVSADASISSGNSSLNSQTFAGIDPVAFAKAFGLDFNKKTEVEVEKVVEEKPEPVVQASVPAVLTPQTIDLYALGYRLKGIVLEKDGNSAAFIFEPNGRKTVVVREKSPGEITMISATMRSVKIETPDGTGELELDDAKGSKGGAPGFLKPFAAPSSSDSKSSTIPKAEVLLRQTQTSAGSIAEMISEGHFQVRPERGVFKVDVRKVPDSFSGYGLRPGDKIVGTSNGDFRQSQDVALELGKVSERPLPIKIQRGRRTIFLNPPPRPKTDKQAPNAKQD